MSVDGLAPSPDASRQPIGEASGRAWWRRNRLWLALLLPLVVLALLATSFRLQKIYLPWYWTRPHVAQGTSMTFQQDWRSENTTFRRTVDLSVVSVTQVYSLDDALAVPGGILYRVEITASAAPDQILNLCKVWLEGPDGTLYDGGTAGKVEAPGGYMRMTAQCVPEDAPGPTIDYDGTTVVPSPEPRPASWSIVTGVVLPATVTPTKVRIAWNEPDYAVLAVPR